MKLEDDPAYMAKGHDVYNVDNLDHYIHPKNSTIRYSVFCTRGGFNPGELDLCSIRVAYPYGTSVMLIASQYFSGKLPEISHNFEPIAARMLEIAICLDVTDESDAELPTSEIPMLEQNPDLKGCRILIGS